jgi:hypothetical protein
MSVDCYWRRGEVDSRSGGWVQRSYVGPEGALVARHLESQMAQCPCGEQG